MARKKKHKKVHHRRRSHSGMGAINAAGIMQGLKLIGAVTGGFLVTRVINNQLAKMTTPPSGTMVGAGELAVGALLAVKVKHPLVKAVGVGMGASGGITLLGSSGLKLLPATIGYAPHNIGPGFRQVPMVGNFPKPNQIGFPKPANIGASDIDRRRMHRMYAGIYG
jgi:hypothetical protein